MRIFLNILIFCIISPSLLATDLWQFENRVAITDTAKKGVFHHLEGAGRKHIAVAGGTVAVVWEDDSSGDPQIYLATKKAGDTRFAAEIRVSNGLEAYEPAIIAAENTSFIIAWEQDGVVFARSMNQQLSKEVRLSSDTASQVSLAALDNRVFAVWREQQGNSWSLWLARLSPETSGELTLRSKNRVETKQLDTPVLYPTLAANDTGLMVAWEDRQSGHTRLKYSFSDNEGRTFAEPQYLNEFFSNRNEYDKGSGVTRVSMATFAEDEIVATWMDKRRGGAGYGIFAATGSGNSFGPNEKVHGEDGDKLPHYNPATTGNRAGDFVVTWDDYRLGNSDIWLSSYNENSEWSRDYSPGPASGKGEQTHASVTLDESSGLHLVWVERDEIDGPTRLWYSYAQSR